MDKLRKLELIQRSLGLRHKLKVHESMKAPDTHEDIAIMLLTKWEYEDELHAIEEMLTESRQKNTAKKRALLEKAVEDGEEAEAMAAHDKEKKKTKK
jgi:HD-like signal output (HDOD) protein